MAIYMWREFTPPSDRLKFAAEQANSTIQLSKNGSPYVSVNLEISTDGISWSDYNFTTITLANIGDVIYMRNKSETPTGLNTNGSSGQVSQNHYYRFVITGEVAVTGDIGYLLCKNSTNTISDYAFWRLFQDVTTITSCPSLPATTIGQYSYYQMFLGTLSSSKLKTIPKIFATNLPTGSCQAVFSFQKGIKVSTTQDSDYTQPYRIPREGTGTASSYALDSFFSYTGGSFKGTPGVNTTYYLHKDNTIV